MGLLDGIFSGELNPLGGFKVTLDHMRQTRVTNQYPKVKRLKPPRAHGRHILNRYEDGMEKCIGCELCAAVCPADCIYVRGKDNDPADPTSPGERYGFVYEINYLRCIHCDMCVEACPTEAITESKLLEFSFTNRADAIYTKNELVVDDEGHPRKQPWEDWREGNDLHSSAWMRATAPAGNAAYEGKVQWTPELGYGTRAPEAGQSSNRDDAATGNLSLAELLPKHLLPEEKPIFAKSAKRSAGKSLNKSAGESTENNTGAGTGTAAGTGGTGTAADTVNDQERNSGNQNSGNDVEGGG